MVKYKVRIKENENEIKQFIYFDEKQMYEDLKYGDLYKYRKPPYKIVIEPQFIRVINLQEENQAE